ncbi:MAG: monovalent cation/H+ antiporter complex subunit F [Deltaproteobacteria bacterium]
MQSLIIAVGVALFLLMMATLYRAIFGPTVLDRIVGVNVIGTKSTVLIIIIGTLNNQVDMFVDIALTYALLNFIVTLAAARFFQRHKGIDEEDNGGYQ